MLLAQSSLWDLCAGGLAHWAGIQAETLHSKAAAVTAAACAHAGGAVHTTPLTICAIHRCRTSARHIRLSRGGGDTLCTDYCVITGHLLASPTVCCMCGISNECLPKLPQVQMEESCQGYDAIHASELYEVYCRTHSAPVRQRRYAPCPALSWTKNNYPPPSDQQYCKSLASSCKEYTRRMMTPVLDTSKYNMARHGQAGSSVQTSLQS